MSNTKDFDWDNWQRLKEKPVLTNEQEEFERLSELVHRFHNNEDKSKQISLQKRIEEHSETQNSVSIMSTQISKVYDKENNTALIPFSVFDYKLYRSALEKSGAVFLEDFSLPFDIPFLFWLVQLPKDWKITEDEEEDTTVYDFVDAKNRVRLRIVFSDILIHSKLYCRYGKDFLFRKDKHEYVVVDLEKLPTLEDDELDDSDRVDITPAIIYEKKEKEEDEPEVWLNKHFPDWQNPAAYWS